LTPSRIRHRHLRAGNAAHAVCALLLQDARVIVLDEPFNAVDAKTRPICSIWSTLAASSAPCSPPCTISISCAPFSRGAAVARSRWLGQHRDRDA
jgi:hypothetical protein